MANGVWTFFEPMRKDHLTVGEHDQYGKDLLETDLFMALLFSSDLAGQETRGCTSTGGSTELSWHRRSMAHPAVPADT